MSHASPLEKILSPSLFLSSQILGNVVPYNEHSDGRSESFGGLNSSPATAFHQQFTLPLSLDDTIFSPDIGITSPASREPSNLVEPPREGVHHALVNQAPTPQMFCQQGSASACNCHATALSTLSSLHADLETTSALPFDSGELNAILATCRHAVMICEAAGSCQRCPKTVMLMLCTAILQRVAICYETLSSNSCNDSVSFSIRMGDMDFSEVANNPSIMKAVIQGEKKRAQNVCERLQVESVRFQKSATPGNRPDESIEGVRSEELAMLLKVTREKFVRSNAIARAI